MICSCSQNWYVWIDSTNGWLSNRRKDIAWTNYLFNFADLYMIKWHVKYTSLQFSSCFEEVVYLQCKHIPITVMVFCITTNIWPHIRLTYMHAQCKNLSKMFTNIWICTVITWLMFTCCIPNVFSERYLILWMPPPPLPHTLDIDDSGGNNSCSLMF